LRPLVDTSVGKFGLGGFVGRHRSQCQLSPS
jgi:hypothetical protein